MNDKKSFLDRVLESLIRKSKTKNQAHSRKRKLGLESLEAREMLTAVGFLSVPSIVEGETAVIRLQRDDAQGDLAVRYEINSSGSSSNEGQAVRGDDFAPLSGTAAFQNGQLYTDIYVTALADDLVEGDERLEIKLVDASDGSYRVDGVARRAALMILDTQTSSGTSSTSRLYDENGNVLRETDSDGNSTRYVYDANGRLVRSVTEAAHPDVPPPVFDLNEDDALAFDGVDDTVSLGNPPELDITGTITVSARFRAESTSGIRNIVAHGHVSNSQGKSEVFLRIQNGRYQFGSWTGSDHMVSVQIPPEDVGEWVELTGVYDGTAWRLYRNGVEIGTQTSSTGAVSVPGDWAIGSRGDGTARFFKGEIADVAVFDRAFSASEARLLYEGGSRDALRIRYEYDKNGRLSARRDTSGEHVSYEYDASGRLISERSSLGKLKEYEYDEEGRLTSTTTSRDAEPTGETDPGGDEPGGETGQPPLGGSEADDAILDENPMPEIALPDFGDEFPEIENDPVYAEAIREIEEWYENEVAALQGTFDGDCEALVQAYNTAIQNAWDAYEAIQSDVRNSERITTSN